MEKRENLLKKDLRNNLFNLFAGWSGRFGQVFSDHHHHSTGSGGTGKSSHSFHPASASSSAAAVSSAKMTEFEYSALESMIAVLCCGPFFNDSGHSEDGPLYQFLDSLLESKDQRVRAALSLNSMFSQMGFFYTTGQK